MSMHVYQKQGKLQTYCLKDGLELRYFIDLKR